MCSSLLTADEYFEELQSEAIKLAVSLFSTSSAGSELVRPIFLSVVEKSLQS
jgi:hypothetical protein